MLVDTHAHLSGLRKRGIDPHEILNGLFTEGLFAEGLFAEGLWRIIDISLEPGDLTGRMEEFSVYPQVYFAGGLWPHRSAIANRETLVRKLEQELRAVQQGEKAARLCALGEFGLDHHWEDGEEADLTGERELMEMQLELAEALKLPVIIHSRDAAKETAEILARYPRNRAPRDRASRNRGVIHCFSYGKEDAKTFLDMGYFISFAGNITYKNAGAIREACAFVPPDRLLLETDCPYLAPVPHRGKPAHPGMVEEVYKTAAEVRGTAIEAMAEQIAENVRELFGIG